MTTWTKIDEQIAAYRKALSDSTIKLRHQVKQGFFKFKPFSQKQKMVLTWWCPSSPVKDSEGIIADGSIRSGKTVCMSLSYVVWAMQAFDGQNFAICGKTIGSLRRNVMFWLKLMLRSRGYTVQDRRSENLMIVRRGERLNYFYQFGGKDERSQDLIQGITLAGVLFDEVALMPESFVNQATARCSVTGSKFWFNCNPEGPQHWFYTNWITKCKKRRLLYLHFTMDDNLSLGDDIKARYRSQYVGVFYNRFVLGMWCLATGLVYPMFDRDKNTVPEFLGTGRYWISIDYGIQNPFSAGLWCLRDGVATRVAEYYHDGRKTKQQRTDEEHYAEVEKLASDRYIERVVVDPSASSFIETVYRHGRFPVDKARNDVIPGIAAVSSLLAAGKIQICECCEDCIREFEAYSWDPDKPEDTVIKEFDHAMDDVRYFTSTILRNELRWVDWNGKQ